MSSNPPITTNLTQKLSEKDCAKESPNEIIKDSGKEPKGLKKDSGNEFKAVFSKKDSAKEAALEAAYLSVQVLPAKGIGKKVIPGGGYITGQKRESSRYFRPPEVLEAPMDVEQKVVTATPNVQVKIREDSLFGGCSTETIVSFEDYGKYLPERRNRTPTTEEIQEAAERFLRVKQLMKEQEQMDAKRKTRSPKIDSCIFQGKPSSALSLFDNLKKLAKTFKKKD